MPHIQVTLLTCMCKVLFVQVLDVLLGLIPLKDFAHGKSKIACKLNFLAQANFQKQWYHLQWQLPKRRKIKAKINHKNWVTSCIYFPDDCGRFPNKEKKPYFIINMRHTAHIFGQHLKAAWPSCSVTAKVSPKISDHKADIIATIASSKDFLLLWSGIALVPQYLPNPLILCKKKIFEWLNDTQQFLESINYFLYIC